MEALYLFDHQLELLGSIFRLIKGEVQIGEPVSALYSKHEEAVLSEFFQERFSYLSKTSARKARVIVTLRHYGMRNSVGTDAFPDILISLAVMDDILDTT